MAIKSFTIKKETLIKNGLRVEEISLSFQTDKPNQNPTQAEALDLLADAMKMICSQTLKKTELCS